MPPKTRFTYRHQYDEAADAIERANTDIGDLGPSLTQQHFTADADLNEIVRRYGVTDGAIPPAPQDPSAYGDFTDVPTFRQAMDNVAEAKNRFMSLPAALRAKFNNNAGIMFDWVSNPDNTEEAIKLGFLKRVEPVETPTAAAVTPPPATST